MTDLSSEVREYVLAHPYRRSFKSCPHYLPEGDQVNWYFKEDQCYEENIQVDGVNVGAVMKSMETHEIVGVKIYSIKYLMKLKEAVS